MLDSNHDDVGRYDLEDHPPVAGADPMVTRPLATKRLGTRNRRPTRQPLEHLKHTRPDDDGQIVELRPSLWGKKYAHR